jgi:Na+/H+ antiporter NhaD/arsenite permease-like protein
MFGLSIPAEIAPFVAMAILAAMFVLFVLERTPVEVTAIGGATLMLVLGILPVKEATEVWRTPHPGRLR